ncbi:MAG: sulfatase-like hydrolase/transferase [Blastocatellia bacterium]
MKLFRPFQPQSFAAVCVAAAVWLLPAGPRQTGAIAGNRPNIILLMADDQGWGDTGYNGHRILRTPNLDAMAKAGLRFNRFYAGAPVCSPTRGSVLTGRHPYRYGILYANADSGDGPSRYALPLRELTLAETVKTRGYATGHFGKWHLGDFAGPKKSSPSDNGFDEWFSTVRKVPTLDPSGYWHNGVPVKEQLAGDDSRIIMDRALPFIEKAVSGGKPFLAVIWFHTPHLPVSAAPEQRAKFASYTEKEQHYWGALTALDEQVGRLRGELRRLDVHRNTMLWYASDNGPEGDAPGTEWPGSAGPWRGRKRSLFEGGIRVPGILEWPARVKSGRVVEMACSTSDYYPTALELLGIKNETQLLDGVSLAPLINGKMKERPSAIGFETMGNTRGSPKLAWIENRYKLLTSLDGGEALLFDLQQDPGETKNLAAIMPEKVKAMESALRKWRESCAASNAGKDYRNQ